MKKMILTAIAALLIAVPAVQAQKVNKSAILAKIEKSDAEIGDAKKNVKAATWINRGKAFYEAAIEPTKSLFVNMDAAMLKLAVGDPDSKQDGVELPAGVYTALVYPYFTVYIKDNKITVWKQTQEIYPNAVEKAVEAYTKAYELDSKVADKVKEGLKQLSDFCSQTGNVNPDLGEYLTAANAYSLAYDIQTAPAWSGESDKVLLYYAGYLRTVDGTKNPESFVLGAKLLNKALEVGYADEKGDIYYYLFHCYYGQKAADPAFIIKAKDVLLAGIAKFPKNEKILDGLMQLYTSEEGVGNPADLVTMIDAAIQENPDNVDLWFGRGRIFYAQQNHDESIASFTKAVELKPDLYESNYTLGMMYIVKGDAMNKELNDKQHTSQTAYDAELKAVNSIYLQAIPWLERALQVKPGDENVLDYLKQLCFRMRDEEGVMDKYNTYNAQLKKVRGEE